MRDIVLRVNGLEHPVRVEDHWTLLDVLRNQLGYTGAKKGCDKGECGACTVLVDGQSLQACLLLAVQMVGREVTTVEGLSQGSDLDPVQSAFHELGAVQCGFCTPGMIMTTKALLAKNPDPSVDQIRSELSGNFCRCTGYVKIVAAVQKAAAATRAEPAGGAP